MSWTLDKVQGLFDRMHEDRQNAMAKWNKENPPLKEFYIQEDLDIKVKYGMWKVKGAVMVIPKSKSGYSLDRKILVSDEIIKAIQEIS